MCNTYFWVDPITGQPRTEAAEQEEPEQDADHQAGGDQPLPRAGPGDVAAVRRSQS